MEEGERGRFLKNIKNCIYSYYYTDEDYEYVYEAVVGKWEGSFYVEHWGGVLVFIFLSGLEIVYERVGHGLLVVDEEGCDVVGEEGVFFCLYVLIEFVYELGEFIPIDFDFFSADGVDDGGDFFICNGLKTVFDDDGNFFVLFIYI